MAQLSHCGNGFALVCAVANLTHNIMGWVWRIKNNFHLEFLLFAACRISSIVYVFWGILISV